MPSPFRPITVTRNAGWSRTARRTLPFLLSGLACLSGHPAIAQTGGAAPAASTTRPMDRVPPDRPFAVHVAEAAQRFGLPAAWIRAVIQAESGGDPRAVSVKGAMGLMQIMPETWADLRLRHALGDDPFDPRDNILAGAGYLRDLLDRYGSPGFLAAYNAGPGRYEDHLAGRPLPSETRAYLATLLPTLDDAGHTARMDAGSKPERTSWTAAPLFVALAGRTPAADPVQPGRTPEGTLPAAPVRDLSAILPQPGGLFVTPSGAGLPERRARSLASPGVPSDGTDGQAGGTEDHDQRTAR
ncbi:lytic transglycosylase domain-containing protein [Azospirillum agricola]|uniref:lytic transglycosylase domain-containing protein n=1 Tax=Azospirillum agricola TaxID=1720247 RepID=UPI000A0F11DA|nr:lytic transglycosylase domain-containing protein [Azospirillum agricola]SMH43329.1 Transglycosylase SLT domain-containing protein [Azospirillum lipoferum]